MTNRIDILTPVGRMVQGHPFKKQTTGYKGAPLLTKEGKPTHKYFFAIAIPKTDETWPAIHKQIQDVAASGFPNGEPSKPDFSWKIENGDDPEFVNKAGFIGNWVIKCSTQFDIRVYTKGGQAQIVESSQLKRGDYIRAYLTIRSNRESGKPGIYINPTMVELIGYGEEIGVDATAIFGKVEAVVPAGISETPVAPAVPIAPPPPPPAVTQGKVMTELANGTSYDDYIASGWNDQQLIDGGYMVVSAVAPAPNFMSA